MAAAPGAAQPGTSEERFATAVVFGFPRVAPDRLDVVNVGHSGPYVLGRHQCTGSSATPLC
ncbi:hypothetical protein ACIQB5_46015 [Streptomyces sp. NPDC088560]|uniref:hypothetical protein n=1 Tax=Streptomyces sp. NPDC088560 TaxID=3365868 RepID=UPI00381F4994